MQNSDRRSPPSPEGVSRRGAIGATAGGLLATVVGVASAAPEQGSRGQLGVRGPANGIELLGEILQEGNSLTAYGYFTAVAGLTPDQLYFPGVDRSEATARFTFFGTATVATLNRREGFFVASANGGLQMYLRDAPGASFDAPASFTQGQRIAADDASFENVLSVTAPNTAATHVFGDLRRVEAAPFLLDGVRYQLGHIALRSRLDAPGRGTRTEPTMPRAVLVVGGNLTNPT